MSNLGSSCVNGKNTHNFGVNKFDKIRQIGEM